MGLVLPQLNVSDFTDFPWEHLHFGRSVLGLAGGSEGGHEEEWEGELWLEGKIKFKAEVKN